MDNTTAICKYSHCLHNNREIEKEKAVRVGNAYYHSDCLKTKEDIKEIVDLFKTHINPNPVYAQLQSVINNIIFVKKVQSDFLLFGLRYYIEHKIPLNYPQGLYYVIQNKDVTNAYNKTKTKEIKKSVEITEQTEAEFEFVPTKNKGFADIIK